MLSADLLVVRHLLWIVFLILGALPGHYLRWARNIHLAALARSPISGTGCTASTRRSLPVAADSIRTTLSAWSMPTCHGGWC